MENRDKEQRADSTKTYCKICFKETAPNPKCFGHGGKDSGGSSNDSSSEKASKSDGPTSANTPGQTTETSASASNQRTDGVSISEQPASLNREVISELLSKRLLLIDNDRNAGILSIKLQYNPTMLAAEQRSELKNFVNAILKELEAFKKDKGITSNCATINNDSAGNFLSLLITLPKPTMYDAFIQRLADKNLLPTQSIEQKEKVVFEDRVNHFNPSPLSTKPTASMNKQAKPEDEEKASSIRPKSPLDGLKPKDM